MTSTIQSTEHRRRFLTFCSLALASLACAAACVLFTPAASAQTSTAKPAPTAEPTPAFLLASDYCLLSTAVYNAAVGKLYSTSGTFEGGTLSVRSAHGEG